MKPKLLTRKEIVLISLWFIREAHSDLEIEKITKCLDLKENSLKRYLKDLEKKGLIEILKKAGSRISGCRIEEKGREGSMKILENIRGQVLDPKDTGLSGKIKLKSILDHISDPYEKIQFLDAVISKGHYDVNSVIRDIRDRRPDSLLNKYVSEVARIGIDTDNQDLKGIMESYTFYGIKSIYDSNKSELKHNIEDMIFNAEISRRSGFIEEAMNIYEGLFNMKKGLDPGIWLLSFSGYFQCKVFMNEEIEGLKILDDAINDISDPIEKGFLKKVKADIIQGLGRSDEASVLYKSCLGLFQVNEHPMIRAMILNNLGVLYFRKDEVEISTKLWEESLGILKDQGLEWSAHMASINLADAYALKGNPERALRILGKARTFLKKIGDLEGISEIDFNMALVQIELGDLEKAEKYFKKAESFPLTYKRKRDEWRSVFEGRKKDRRKKLHDPL